MSERLRGVLAFAGACLVVATVALVYWPASFATAGAPLLYLSLRK